MYTKNELMRQTKKHVELSNVGTGTIASGMVNVVGSQHVLFLRCTDKDGDRVSVANLKALAGLINLELDGTSIQTLTSTEALMLELYKLESKGVANKTGLIPIYFDAVEHGSFVEQLYESLGTANIRNMGIELNLGATNVVATDGHIAKVEAITEFTTVGKKLGQHRRVRRYTVNLATTDEDITSLPFGKWADTYKAIHIYDPNDRITGVSVEIDSEKIIDEMNYSDMTERVERAGRSAQSDWYHIDLNTINDVIKGGLFTENASDFRINLTSSAALGSTIIIVETTSGAKRIVKRAA